MHLRANVTYSVSLTVFLFTHSPTPCLLDSYSIISHHRILSISLSFFILSCSPTPYLFDSFIDHLMSWTMIILSLLFSFLLLHLFSISLSPSPAPCLLDRYSIISHHRILSLSFFIFIYLPLLLPTYWTALLTTL